MAAKYSNVSYTIGFNALTNNLPTSDNIITTFISEETLGVKIDNSTRRGYFEGAYGLLPIREKQQDNLGEIQQGNAAAYFHVFCVPNSSSNYSVYLIVGKNTSTFDELPEDIQMIYHGNEEEWAYLNNTRIYSTDDFNTQFTGLTGWKILRTYKIGTFNYNEVPVINGVTGSFIFKLGFSGNSGEKNVEIPQIAEGEIPYSCTFRILPVIQLPTITEVEQNPLYTNVNRTNNTTSEDTTVYFTTQVPKTGTGAAEFRAAIGTNSIETKWKQLVPGVNQMTFSSGENALTRFTDSTTIQTSNISFQVQYRVTAAASLSGQCGMQNPQTGLFDESIEIPCSSTWEYLRNLTIPMAFKPYVAAPSLTGNYMASSTTFSYQVLDRKVTKYGTFDTKRLVTVMPVIESNGATFDLSIRVSGLHRVNAVTSYLYINGTRVSGVDADEGKVGTYSFNSSAPPAVKVAVGELYSSMSNASRPEELKGDTLTINFTPILAYPKITFRQSVDPYQMNQSGQELRLSVSDELGGTYIPTFTYQLYSAMLQTTIDVDADAAIIMQLPNTLEEYTKAKINSPALDRTIAFDIATIGFRTTGTTPSSDWPVFVNGSIHAYSTLSSISINPTLNVHLDVSNGPTILTASIEKGSDHPHTELLLVGRGDTLTVNYTFKTGASWITNQGMTLLFEDQTYSKMNLRPGDVVGPFSNLPYTQGKACTISGYLVDSLGRHGPQVKIAVSESGTAIPSLYAYYYNAPSLTMTGFRADAQGTLDEENGTYAKATYSWNVTPLRSYLPTIKLELKNDRTGVIAKTLTPSLSANAGSTTATFDSLSLDDSYSIIGTLTDAIGTVVTFSFAILSGKVFMDFKAGGHGLGIGQRAEIDERLEIGWDTKIKKHLMVDGEITGPTIDGLWDAINNSSGGSITIPKHSGTGSFDLVHNGSGIAKNSSPWSLVRIPLTGKVGGLVLARATFTGVYSGASKNLPFPVNTTWLNSGFYYVDDNGGTLNASGTINSNSTITFTFSGTSSKTISVFVIYIAAYDSLEDTIISNGSVTVTIPAQTVTGGGGGTSGVTKEQVQNMISGSLSGYATLQQVNSAVASGIAGLPTATQVTNSINTALKNYYIKSEVDALIASIKPGLSEQEVEQIVDDKLIDIETAIQEAIETASGAVTVAGNAYDAAESAATKATNAETIAKEAKEIAEGAGAIDSKATKAMEDAASALTAAKSAKTTAEEIDGKATQAQTDAADAKKIAEEAKKIAEQAAGQVLPSAAQVTFEDSISLGATDVQSAIVALHSLFTSIVDGNSMKF